jgi:hypothetical protein
MRSGIESTKLKVRTRKFDSGLLASLSVSLFLLCGKQSISYSFLSIVHFTMSALGSF